MGFDQDTLLQLKARAITWARARARQAPVIARRLSKKPATVPLLILLVVMPALALFNAFTAKAVNGTLVTSGITLPENSVWLGGDVAGTTGHFWVPQNGVGPFVAGKAGAPPAPAFTGFCRLDSNGAGGLDVNTASCDNTAKQAVQAVTGPLFTDATTGKQLRDVYLADLGVKSLGPKRITFDATLDGGNGGIVAGSGVLVAPQGGVAGSSCANGLFCDPTTGASFKNAGVAIGPDGNLYAGFLRSQHIVRITNPGAADLTTQTAVEIAKTSDPHHKGVKGGIAIFNHPSADGTHTVGDMYISEVGGDGVTIMTDVATCPALDPSTGLGGCATVFSPMSIFFPSSMAVFPQNDGTTTSQYLYVGTAPTNALVGSVMRYNPTTNVQDLYSENVPSYVSPYNGLTTTTYQQVTGLGVDPAGDVLIGDDPTFNVLNEVFEVGHLWTVPAGAAPDCVGLPGQPCQPATPPGTIPGQTATLFAWGLQAPVGGGVLLPDASGVEHIWISDEGDGFCRTDVVPGTSLEAVNLATCDDATIGSPAQAVYDPTVNTGIAGVPDGTHFVYVDEIDRFSRGLWRFVYDPNGDSGLGAVSSPVLMTANTQFNAVPRLIGLALAPDGALYFTGQFDDLIRRVNNPRADPRVQTIDVVAKSTDGRGFNGTIGILANPLEGAGAYDIYYGENRDFAVLQNAGACGRNGAVPCVGSILPIGTPGAVFGGGIAVDTVNNLVYASDAPGFGASTIYQYNPADNTAAVYVTQGMVPAAGTPNATVYASMNGTNLNTRPFDPSLTPGSPTVMPFALGMVVDQNSGTLYIFDDPLTGVRAGHGRIWSYGFVPAPAAPAGSGPLPTPTPISSTQVCTATVNLPALASGQTFWVPFSTTATGLISATWTIPVPQSAALAIYAGNPFAGNTDPVSKGTQGKPLALQNTSNTNQFSVKTASVEPVGSYTVQFFDASSALPATTGSITFTDSNTTACPTTLP